MTASAGVLLDRRTAITLVAQAKLLESQKKAKPSVATTCTKAALSGHSMDTARAILSKCTSALHVGRSTRVRSARAAPRRGGGARFFNADVRSILMVMWHFKGTCNSSAQHRAVFAPVVLVRHQAQTHQGVCNLHRRRHSHQTVAKAPKAPKAAKAGKA